MLVNLEARIKIDFPAQFLVLSSGLLKRKFDFLNVFGNFWYKHPESVKHSILVKIKIINYLSESFCMAVEWYKFSNFFFLKNFFLKNIP